MAHKWSPAQEAIFREVANGEDHLLILARAGCAKTSSICEASARLSTDEHILMCAFNREIAEELETKVKPHIHVSTMHSLGLRALQRNWSRVGRLTVDANREREILKKVLPRIIYEDPEIRGDIQELVRKAKAFVVDSDKELEDLMARYDVYPSTRAEENLPLYCKWARDALELSRTPHPTITFDDMIYVPAYLQLTVGRYNFAFVDEVQDLNVAQLIIAEHAIRPRDRLIFVGDDRQGIYAFRGADTRTIPNIKAKFQPKVLMLTTTYRCPKKVVALAAKYVPDFEAAPSAPEGVVEQVSSDYMHEHWRPGDFVIARVNSVLVNLCMQALANGIPAYMAGRDLGAGLVKMIEKSNCHTIPQLMLWVNVWAETERGRLVAAEADETALTALQDKADTLLALAAEKESVEELLGFVRSLFVDEKAAKSHTRPRLAFMTAHRAKGLENPVVWLIESTFKPGRSREDENLYYVAVTRAQRELYRVYLNKKHTTRDHVQKTEEGA